MHLPANSREITHGGYIAMLYRDGVELTHLLLVEPEFRRTRHESRVFAFCSLASLFSRFLCEFTRLGWPGECHLTADTAISHRHIKLLSTERCGT